MAAILENGQEADGTVTVPDALRPFLKLSRLTPEGISNVSKGKEALMLKTLVKGGVLGGLTMFLWGTVSWAVLPWNRGNSRTFVDREGRGGDPYCERAGAGGLCVAAV